MGRRVAKCYPRIHVKNAKWTGLHRIAVFYGGDLDILGLHKTILRTQVCRDESGRVHVGSRAAKKFNFTNNHLHYFAATRLAERGGHSPRTFADSHTYPEYITRASEMFDGVSKRTIAGGTLQFYRIRADWLERNLVKFVKLFGRIEELPTFPPKPPIPLPALLRTDDKQLVDSTDRNIQTPEMEVHGPTKILQTRVSVPTPRMREQFPPAHRTATSRVLARLENCDGESRSGGRFAPRKRPRPTAQRNALWLQWYDANGEDTYHSPAEIRDRWNREHPNEAISDGANGIDVVKKALKVARNEFVPSPT